MIDLVAIFAGALLILGYWCLVSFAALGLWWLVLALVPPMEPYE